ncbi:MAG: hypothetical protein MJY57_05295 [Bacteroidales bacterium]|nr:hypothetical protein [Bacteroidales bacterium]
MKKLYVLTAAMLQCILALGQGAESSGISAGLTVIPRLEGVANFNKDNDPSSSINPGSSSLYTLFEGQFSENVSWTFVNQWLSTDPALLYNNTWRSDDVNWVMTAAVDFTFGNWDFRLGKDMIATGGYEEDVWDWDAHSYLMSSFYNTLACYQWGVSATWTNNSENTSLMAQMTTSPYGEHPFSSGLYNYSLMWDGSYGVYSNKWSATAFQTAPDTFKWVFWLGNQWELGNFTLYLDASNVMGWGDEYGDSEYEVFVPGCTAVARVEYNFGDKLELGAKYALQGWKDTESNKINTDCGFCGIYAQWYPLPSSRDLRVYAGCGADRMSSSINASLGLLYQFSLPRKK